MWKELNEFFGGFLFQIYGALSRVSKVGSKGPQPIEDIEVPVAEVGKEIPVLFGTRDVKNTNVVWYGDLSTRPIKKKGGKK